MPDIFLTRQAGTQADKKGSTKAVKSYYEIYIQQ
jgi:hypothetical protein